MKKTTKTRAGAVTPTRAAENGTACKTARASATKHTISAAGRQSFHVADLLPYGEESGVTLRHLEKLTGLEGREVRRQIERERRAGTLIISNNRNGYYLTDDPAEAQRFARSMRHRAREILRTARAIEGAAKID